MKKINLSEAANIVGGTFVCTKEFAWVGGGNNRTCQLVTTCADKFGGVKNLSSGAGGELPFHADNPELMRAERLQLG
ncbi:DUF4762 family protein [Serratia ureilytica]